MSRIKKLDVKTFLDLINLAQLIHTEKKEPIPAFSNSKIGELESCLDTPFMGYGGKLFYKGLIKKASILFYFLARNHVMSNGNKRLACLSLSYFCFINGKWLNATEPNLYKLTLNTVIAAEDDKDKTIRSIEMFLKNNLSPIH